MPAADTAPPPPPAPPAHWHPMELLPVLQCMPRGPWRDAAQTGLLNLLVAGLILGVTLMDTPMDRIAGTVFRTVVVAQCVGFSIHAGFELSTCWLGARLARAPDALRIAWNAVLCIAGVFTGYAVGALLLGAGWQHWLLTLRGSAVVAVLGTFLSLVLFAAWRATQRQAQADAALAQARAREMAIEREALAARLRMLQAQIEPHFLYNTLANAVALIDPAPATARHLLERLIDYLRAGLQASRADAHTLGREFALLGAYLDLMALRMGPRLHWHLAADPALDALPVAPMLLQPLVENAITHGLEPAVAGGRVDLGARVERGRLVLEVVDTGVGIATHRAPPAPTPAGDGRAAGGVGLANVRERLQALHGAAATLTLADRPGGGTIARIELPLPA